MDISSFKAFLALADNLNFTKSAESLYVSQPAFSRIITKLEDEFGCVLFMRNKRTVELTEYGRTFYKYAQQIDNAYLQWLSTLNLMKESKMGHLRIGFLYDFPHPILSKTIRKFRQDYGEIDISFADCTMTNITQRILTNEIDIGFSILGDATKHKSISHITLRKLPLCAILAKDHPLADHDSIRLKELKDETFILNAIDGYGPGSRQIIRLCSQAGFELNKIVFSSSVSSMQILVESGVGVSIGVMLSDKPPTPGIKLMPLVEEEQEFADLLLFWKTSNNNPTIPVFVDICKTLADEAPPLGPPMQNTK
jgi:DNA-binding transcriptional LysR family regulator